MLLAALLACSVLAQAAQQCIFVVESYHVEYAWDASYKEALQAALGGKYRLEYFQLDSKRLPLDRHAGMADKAWARFQELKPDLVIVGDDTALKLLAARLGATTTPVVYLGINNNPRAYFDRALVHNITGVLERPLLKRNIAFAGRLLPKARRALVLFDTDITAQVVLRDVLGGMARQRIHGIDVELKMIGRLDQWQAEVLNAAANYDMMFVGLYQSVHDASGASVDSTELVRWTSAHTPVPAFGFWDFSVGPDKAIGGLVLYGGDQGKAAAELALRILAGTPPGKIYPVTGERGALLFSRSQLRRYGLTLPPEMAVSAGYTD